MIVSPIRNFFYSFKLNFPAEPDTADYQLCPEYSSFQAKALRLALFFQIPFRSPWDSIGELSTQHGARQNWVCFHQVSNCDFLP